MKPKTYCPVIDGIPGLFSGSPSVVIINDEDIPVYPTPKKDSLHNVYDGSNSVKSLNRRMMKK